MIRIAVRVDASTAIGHGHVKRCLSLAHALRAHGAQPRFVCRDLGMNIAASVQAGGFACATLPAPTNVGAAVDSVPHAAWAGVGWRTDASQTIEAVRDAPVDAVLVDHYAFDARWHREVASGLDCRIVAIDDLADREIAADVLIDHNQADDHRLKYSGLLSERAALLGGPRYALLGPTYALAPRYSFHATVRSIGIFMGGTDVGNFSLMSVHACRDAGFRGPVELVSTTDNEHLPLLRAAAAADPLIRLSIDLPDLTEFFARHDVQIGACGGATWERCCIGSPTIALVVAQNQRMVLDPLRRSDVVHALESSPPRRDELAHSVRWLCDHPNARRRLSEKAMALVDGHGAARVASFLVDA